ncbi:MAG: peroxiredoxin-like family protein [Hyphomicrobiaceae bacterium]
MTLQAELDAFKATWTERVGPVVAQMMSDDNAALLPLAAKALKVGDRFPGLTLADQLGRPTDIAQLLSDGPIVVTFYRGGWCPYCNLELRAYQKMLPEIQALGARLVAVTPETPDNALSTAEKNDLAFAVLSDDAGRLADALGIRFELSDAVKAYFVKAGHDLPARNGNDRWSLPMPATYVVGTGGLIALAFVDPDYRRRLEPAAAIAALRKLRQQPQAA